MVDGYIETVGTYNCTSLFHTLVSSVTQCKLLGVLSDSNAVRYVEATDECEVLTCVPDDDSCSVTSGRLYVTDQYDGKETYIKYY